MKCDEGMLDIILLFIICNSGLAFDGFVESLEGASLAYLIVLWSVDQSFVVTRQANL